MSRAAYYTICGYSGTLELIKKPAHSLEYIIVHEMVHLLERHHNDRFIAYMNSFMPPWQHYREELNRAPLPQQ